MLNDDKSIGVICLDTIFEKIPGHIRNPSTFKFPMKYKVVKGASPERVVVQADPTLIAPFVAAARELQAEGASAIVGACGFLVLFQRQLADSVEIPLFSSSLLQLPLVHSMLSRNRKVGLLVAKKSSLSERHFKAIGAEDIPVCIAGMEDGDEFREVMLEGRRARLDVRQLRQEVLESVRNLADENPDMGALVIECTDLPPFSKDIQSMINIPVFDIVTLTNMVHESLTRMSFPESIGYQ